MATESFKLQAKFKYKTPSFDIQSDLVGAIHQFNVDNHLVEISLPDIKDKEVLSMSSWQEIGDERIAISYTVDEVVVNVFLKQQIELPKKILDQVPNAYDILSQTTQDHLNLIAVANTHLAEKAVSLWSRTMRWKTGNWSIARGEFKSIKSGWGATLIDSVSKKRLWTHHETITVYMKSPVKPADWESVSRSLNNGEEPPVYIDIYFDAEMHLNAGDIRRTLVDLAVATETYIRHIVRESLPADLSHGARDLIERTGILQIMDKLFFESQARLTQVVIDDNVKTKIRELFKARNYAMHRGKVDNINKEICAEYMVAVRNLLGLNGIGRSYLKVTQR